MFSYLSTIYCILSGAIPPAIATASATVHTQTIYHLPASSSIFSPLAKLSFNVSEPERSKVESFTPPARSKSQATEDITSIGVILSRPVPKVLSASDPDLKYRTTLTSLASLNPPYRGRFTVTVTETGDVQSASWSAVAKNANFDGHGEFDLKIIREGPKPIIEAAPLPKSGRTGAQQGQGQSTGEEEEEVEKTFLQKYWWAILGALMLIMVTGGDEK